MLEYGRNAVSKVEKTKKQKIELYIAYLTILQVIQVMLFVLVVHIYYYMDMKYHIQYNNVIYCLIFKNCTTGHL